MAVGERAGLLYISYNLAWCVHVAHSIDFILLFYLDKKIFVQIFQGYRKFYRLVLCYCNLLGNTTIYLKISPGRQIRQECDQLHLENFRHLGDHVLYHSSAAGSQVILRQVPQVNTGFSLVDTIQY